jgi:paraquat-inducible protein A
MRALVAVMLVASPLLFALGITLPLLTFEKLIFFRENPSLLGIVASLWKSGDMALAALVALFSILFPLAKMVAVAAELAATPGWFQKLVPFLIKWSMMDVMLVAIVIAAAKTSGLADAFSEAGLWCYAGATVMTTVLQWTIASGKAR